MSLFDPSCRTKSFLFMTIAGIEDLNFDVGKNENRPNFGVEVFNTLTFEKS